jgi:hypothetical protein
LTQQRNEDSFGVPTDIRSFSSVGRNPFLVIAGGYKATANAEKIRGL